MSARGQRRICNAAKRSWLKRRHQPHWQLRWNVVSGEIYWSEETYSIFEYDRGAKPTLASVLARIHPDDRDLVQQTVDARPIAREI